MYFNLTLVTSCLFLAASATMIMGGNSQRDWAAVYAVSHYFFLLVSEIGKHFLMSKITGYVTKTVPCWDKSPFNESSSFLITRYLS